MLRILVVDNTKDLNHAKMTPVLLEHLRDLGCQTSVASEPDEVIEQLEAETKCDGVILSGGPLCLSEATKIRMYSKNTLSLLRAKCPILGICFGYQVMAAAFGGLIETMDTPIKGMQHVHLSDHPLFYNMPKEVEMMQAHQDRLQTVPWGFQVIATNEAGHPEAIAHEHFYGVQFHPERSGEMGCTLLLNFLNVCRR